MEDTLGFIKVACGTPIVSVANCQRNAQSIIDIMRRAADDGAAILVLPELSLTGYTAADLLSMPFLQREAQLALDNILSMTNTVPIVAVVGLPLPVDGKLYNCAAVISQGELWGIVPKTYIPNYSEFYEMRWFASGATVTQQSIRICDKDVPFGTDLIFTDETKKLKFGIEICEDLWAPHAPSIDMALAGAQIILNLSASDDIVGKDSYRADLVRMHSATTCSAYVFASAGNGESTTDLVFGGAQYIAENGTMLARAERYATDSVITEADIDIRRLDSVRMRDNTFSSVSPAKSFRYIEVPLRTGQDEDMISRAFDPHPFIPSDNSQRNSRCHEIFNIQTHALARRMQASSSSKAVIGVSGGLDSTLALLVAVKTMDLMNRPHSDVVGITMPGFGTTSRTHDNAVGLMKALGITALEIDITEVCRKHMADIGLPADDRSVTFENLQARERTQILMDYANKINGLVVGTGDLSELALGWATYNGDQMSMYGVNAGVPKTLVRYVVSYAAENEMSQSAKTFLLDIIDTPISPELLPADNEGKIAQKTEDLVGPYELHDFFLYNFLRFGFGPRRLFFMASRAFDGVYAPSVIKKWLITFLRRFFSQQFKRSAMPDGPKVGSVSLSPRGDWRMPSDATAAMWLAEAEEL